MSKKSANYQDPLKDLKQFLNQNSTIDIAAVDLDETETNSVLSWSGLESQRAEILELLKAYQRLVRILPSEHTDIIFDLIKEDIHSALQIAAIPRRQFIAAYLAIFDNNNELIADTYERALAVRAEVLRKYMDLRQQNEPYVKQIKK